MSEFKKLTNLISRNIKVYFKDKMLFFVSLITPMILVVLFITFLGNVYESSLTSMLQGVEISGRVIKGFTGGFLFASIMATSSITVAFCSNVVVNDKLNKTINDFNIAPVKSTTIQISYLVANFCTTLIVCSAAFILGLVYLAIVGWYFTFGEIMMIVLVMILNCLLGTLLASIVEMFINTQGGLSGVCTLVSSMYGFICGAYMPLSQFSNGIRTIIGFLPGTYSTVLFKKYFLSGPIRELGKVIPTQAVEEIKTAFDINLTMFNKNVPTWAMFLIVIVALAVLFTVYILLTIFLNRKKNLSVKNNKTKIKQINNENNTGK